jgi:hypothetical protein
MMLDGTLALLDSYGNRIWTAPFAGRPGMFVALREDGNLVAYEPAEYEVWRANPGTTVWNDETGEDDYLPGVGGGPGAFVPTFDASAARLWSGDQVGLQCGSQLQSESGRSTLVMQNVPTIRGRRSE